MLSQVTDSSMSLTLSASWTRDMRTPRTSTTVYVCATELARDIETCQYRCMSKPAAADSLGPLRRAQDYDADGGELTLEPGAQAALT